MNVFKNIKFHLILFASFVVTSVHMYALENTNNSTITYNAARNEYTSTLKEFCEADSSWKYHIVRVSNNNGIYSGTSRNDYYDNNHHPLDPLYAKLCFNRFKTVYEEQNEN